MKKIKMLVGAASLSLLSSSAMAALEFDQLLQGTESEVNTRFEAATKDLGAMFSYKAIAPAEPLGGGIIPVGFDVGVEVTASQLANKDVWGEGVLPSSLDLDYVPLPKVHVHVGIPFGIDFGAVYSALPGGDIGFAGGEVRYSFVSGNVAIPAVAVRGAYTTVLGVDQLELTTKSIEIAISKGFLMVTPYLGAGVVFVDSSLTASDPNISIRPADQSLQLSKFFGGLNLNLGLMNFAFEADKTGDAMAYSLKFGFRF